jgi:phospholipase A1
MEKLIIAVITVLFFAVNGAAGELLAQDGSAKAVQQANPPQEMNKPVSAYKVNYFSINHWPGNNNTQVKFQLSLKFPVLQPDLYVFTNNLFPAYVAYTQKSLWNVGQNSTPFEESNYNPEFFLDYPVNAVINGRLKLRDIVISPFEHESNGLAGIRSRSWRRQYVMLRFGIEPNEKLKITNSFLTDKALLYIKLWYASGYSDQENYLQSIGNNNKFLDYMGWGEIGISLRNFLWGGGLRDHQLDIKTPVFRDSNKESYEFEFRQKLPRMNFALYLQYYYGYGETLLRFDQFDRRGSIGLSFSY